MSKQFTVFADNKIIYSGALNEVPVNLRSNLIEALSDWGDCLSKGGLNELIYSTLHWYKEKNFYCKECDLSFDDADCCENCGTSLKDQFIHKRNPEIDKILDCIGMINRVDIDEL
ncbi:MAG: hypothetical protein ACRENO_06375 [Thermodesulfobacteriota bacterium]